VCLASIRSRHPSVVMATARLGHADLLLRDHDVAWRAIDLIGQSPLPGNHVSLSPDANVLSAISSKPTPRSLPRKTRKRMPANYPGSGLTAYRVHRADYIEHLSGDLSPYPAN
jgi:hypothetical protein